MVGFVFIIDLCMLTIYDYIDCEFRFNQNYYGNGHTYQYLIGFCTAYLANKTC